MAQLKKLVQSTLKGQVENGNDVAACTHLVVVRPVKRTVKLLAAISCPAVRLVTDDWIKACESAKTFVDCKPFDLMGNHASKPGSGSQWAFNAGESRKRAAEVRGSADHQHRASATGCCLSSL